MPPRADAEPLWGGQLHSCTVQWHLRQLQRHCGAEPCADGCVRSSQKRCNTFVLRVMCRGSSALLMFSSTLGYLHRRTSLWRASIWGSVPASVCSAVVEVIRCIGSASLSHVVDVFRGNNTVGVRKMGHGSVAVHGIGKAFCRNNGEAERLVRRMVVQGILLEQTHRPEMHLAVVSTLAVS